MEEEIEITKILELYSDSVSLNIWLDSNCKSKARVFGHIEVGSGVPDDIVIWDNISYFVDLDYHAFEHGSCICDLARIFMENNSLEIFKTIKALISEAQRLNLINEE